MKKTVKNTRIPKNRALEHELLHIIKENHYKPHDRFFSESYLCEHFKMNLLVVRQAIGNLERKGLVYRIHGKGTFIAPPQHNRLIILVSVGSGLYGGEFSAFTMGLLSENTRFNTSYMFIPMAWQQFQEKLPALSQSHPNLWAVVFFMNPDYLISSRKILDNAAIPFLFYGSEIHLPILEECHRLLYDPHKLVYKAMNLLYEKGHRNYAVLFNPNHEVSVQRAAVAQKFCAEHKCILHPENIISCKYKEIETSLTPLLKRTPPGYTAIFSTLGSFGAHAINLLPRFGHQVPQDVSVSAIDEGVCAGYALPRMSAVSIGMLSDAHQIISWANNLADYPDKNDIPFFHGTSEPELLAGESISTATAASTAPVNSAQE
jgi:DNA-binding LacI/PurR family transcriptional regulator